MLRISWPALGSSAVIRWTETLLTVTLAIALADFTWTFLPGPQGATAMMGRPALERGDAAPTRSAQDPGQGAAPSESVRFLFGRPPATREGGGSMTAQEPVKPTQLDLTLKGVLAREGHRKWAIIATADDQEKVYRLGDSVPGGAQLVAIERRQVLLRRDGITERLKLPVEELDGAGKGTGSNRIGGIQRTGDRHRMIEKGYLRQKLQDLPSLLRQAKAIPHKEDGHRVGFRVVNIQEDSVYEQLGIKEGDIVQEVNGRPIRKPSQVMRAYNAFKDASRIRLRLRRDDQPVTLSFRVR